MELSQRVFTRVIAPFMRGKDARDLDQLVDGVFLDALADQGLLADLWVGRSLQSLPKMHAPLVG